MLLEEDMLIIVLLLIPLVVGGAVWVNNNKNYINIVNAVGAFTLLVLSLVAVGEVLRDKAIETDFLNEIFYLDSFSALILGVISVISFFVTVYSIGYMNEEFRRKVISVRKLKIYFSLLNAFIFTMLLTVCTQNMGLMWIAIEATTLASAFLVGFYNNKESLEAAWKYIIICSVGIAFALLGIILLYYSSVHTLGQSAQGLNWQFLFSNADKLQGSILKIAFIFILIGFGTKVGLAPMHTWLPDAHSQAPSPVSALLSGVLLNTAMYGIIRVMILTNKNLGNNIFTGRLMIALGIISIGTAAIFILVQRDFKRILAYSSIEHMGIIAIGFGILSKMSIFGALIHIINHAFTKAMLFIASGNVFLKFDTKKINKVQGILKIMPITGTVFLLGIFAITGVPPFSVFGSELNIIIASFTEKHYIIAGLFLFFLILIFAGFITQMIRMFYGKPISKEIKKGEVDYIGPCILVIFLIFILITGLYLPKPLMNLIEAAKSIIMEGV
jgi:hydrogenase-4 component F